MVQITIDTNSDSVEELENALVVVQQAIARRKGGIKSATPAPAAAVHAPVEEETAIDTPFLKISFSSDEETPVAPTGAPSLNELLTNDQLTEDELTKMFKTVEANEPEHKPKKKTEEAAFIEIVEFDEEEEKEKN